MGAGSSSLCKPWLGLKLRVTISSIIPCRPTGLLCPGCQVLVADSWCLWSIRHWFWAGFCGRNDSKPCVWIKDGGCMHSFNSAGTTGPDTALLSSHVSGGRCWGMLDEAFGCSVLFWKWLENTKRGKDHQTVLAWVKVRRWERRSLGREEVYARGCSSAGGRIGVEGLWSFELLSLSPPLTGGLLLVPFQSDNPLLALEWDACFTEAFLLILKLI